MSTSPEVDEEVPGTCPVHEWTDWRYGPVETGKRERNRRALPAGSEVSPRVVYHLPRTWRTRRIGCPESDTYTHTHKKKNSSMNRIRIDFNPITGLHYAKNGFYQILADRKFLFSVQTPEYSSPAGGTTEFLFKVAGMFFYFVICLLFFAFGQFFPCFIEWLLITRS